MDARYLEELSWRMAEVYEAVVNRILINLARHFQFINAGEVPSGTWLYQTKKLAEMGQVTRETEKIILDMLGDADGVLRALLEESILNGLKDAEPALRKAAEAGLLNGGTVPPALAPGQMQAFQAFYKQSADRLNLVNTVMLESTTWAYQATVADIVNKVNATQGILNVATGEVVTGVSSWNDAIRRGVQKMVENGITGFVDHGDHRWSPEAYVAMDVRTTMANTAREAVSERMKEYGANLYQVSWHNAARPLCFPWQGKVLSTDGWTGEVEDGDGNAVTVHTESEVDDFGYGGSLFGVNCGHYKIPFFPNFSRIREPRQTAEENEKAYQESQKQRYLERKLRNEKRDLEVMKAQGASEEEIKAQRQRVRQASKDIDTFCEETGRTRRRNRETAPVRATWPTETGGPVTRYNQLYISTTQTPPPKGPFVPSVSTRDEANTEYITITVSKPKNAPSSHKLTVENVIEEYKSGGIPGVGTITRESGDRQSVKQHEIDVAKELIRSFGGDVVHIDNSGQKSKRDLLWREKIWEVKRASSTNAAGDRTKNGIKQIRKTGGNIIVDMWGDDYNASENAALRSIERYTDKGQTIDIILMEKGIVQKILRYTKSGIVSTATQ